jgi:hypothetical protein
VRPSSVLRGGIVAVLTSGLLTLGLVAFVPAARAATCDEPGPGWLACEDFEGGSAGWSTWFAQSPFIECDGCLEGGDNPDRIHLSDDPQHVHEGSWAVHMPAAAAAQYQGASLTYRSCLDEARPGCLLQGYEELYFRTWVKLDPDHRYVHHFLAISGTQPDEYWGADGNAGCRPNGVRDAGTTLDFNGERELFFYTYFPDMHCDSGGYCSGEYAQNICDGCATKDMPCTDGLECCWGNHFGPSPAVILERDRWVCLELTMRLNTPGEADGSMAFWVDDELAHEQTGMHWRDVPEVQLNKAWLMHYIAPGDADQSNRISFDDVVVSTQRIGCGSTPPGGSDSDGGTGGDDGPSGADDGGEPTSGGSADSGASGGSDTSSGASTATETDTSAADASQTDGGCGCRSTGQFPAVTMSWPLLLMLRRRRPR